MEELLGGGYSVKKEFLGPNEGVTSFQKLQCFPDTIKPK
jgi:hypothetical protein